jgi:hypothetical protein
MVHGIIPCHTGVNHMVAFNILLGTIRDCSLKRGVMPGNAARTTACRCTLNRPCRQEAGSYGVLPHPVVFELLERSAGVYHGVSTLCVANTIITYLLLWGKVSPVSPSCPSTCNKIDAGGFKLNPRSKSHAWNVIFRG